MKGFVKVFFLYIIICCCTNCSTTHDYVTYKEELNNEESLSIREGILSRTAQKILYFREGHRVAKIELSAPIRIAQAEQEEEWGYFQFPVIGLTEEGYLFVDWQMNSDSYKAYGTSSVRKYTPMVSKDEGKTWRPQDKGYKVYSRNYNARLKNGAELQIKTPKSKEIQAYSSFPKAVITKGKYSYYYENSLPDDLQGIYLSYTDNNDITKEIHAHIEDPGLLRESVNGYMPIVWWGNIKQLSDESLVAGVYPNHYLDQAGNLLPSSVSFYHSKDEGNSWTNIGRIPFVKDGIANVKGDGEFTEPAFEILKDSTFICIMRSGSSSPMYRSFSYDRGKTWTTPSPFTPNGVKPKLLLLDNGVLALVSGRPGIQVRFSLDGTGKKWTEPIDMISFMNEDGSYTRDVSCGYPSILEAGDNSFYLVYSDFTTKNENQEIRKTIWFRKITINLY